MRVTASMQWLSVSVRVAFELFEALTWRMIGTHAHPIALYDVGGYWTHLVQFIDNATREQLVTQEARAFFFVEDDAGRQLQRLFPAPNLNQR